LRRLASNNDLHDYYYDDYYYDYDIDISVAEAKLQQFLILESRFEGFDGK